MAPRGLAAAASVLVAVGCLSCSRLDAPDHRSDGPPALDQEAWDWRTSVSRNGVRRAEVEAAHFAKRGSSDPAALSGGVTVRFFGSSGEDHASTLEADGAAFDEAANRLLAIGSVVVTSRDSIVLKTDTLTWSRDTDLITGNGRVSIRRPDGEEVGFGFEASSDLKRWTMRQVSTRLFQRDSLQQDPP